ncbi:conserved hypothetical protein [Paraburkholderia piptadeniae]|uniref:PAAR repeat-containing protein n=2 Tax=Paraburkholderia piptadeniae TaxID=1701573 RepID=A0A1N7RQK0_9BURK|nr:conserved hypothetical protein [Paraburkholderia piptadeniae]
MRKALIVQGSPTTTGGVVIGGSATDMTDNGRPFTLHGDEATCGKCKGTFQIVGSATRRCYRGRAGVIEGDLVLCPCGENRVLAGPNPGCFYHTDGEGAVAQLLSVDSEEFKPRSGVYDEQFTLKDANGRPLAGVHYRVRIGSDVTASGITDAQGRTKRIHTDNPESICLDVGEAR